VVDGFGSTTFEEVNSSPGSWMKQRARWIKGWMQTMIVHLRSPRQLYRDLGPTRFMVTIFLLIGMVVSPLVHPFLLAATLWTIACGPIIPEKPDIAAALAAGYGAVLFIIGYGVSFASQLKGMAERGLRRSWFSIATLPLYWLLISAAAWMAVWEFWRRPFHWNKTEHGRPRPDRRRKRAPIKRTANLPSMRTVI
jgi:cellulose synthase/poly-beta-1,6-N-acetylglucosamine synthase-like glycosyltransferase